MRLLIKHLPEGNRWNPEMWKTSFKQNNHVWQHQEGAFTSERMSKARFIVVQNVDDVAVTSPIEHPKFCVEGTRCSAGLHAGRGVWLCVCVVSGVIAESLLFPPVTVNNSNQWQPRWSSCICSWSSSTWMNKCPLDHFECQQASSPYTAIKTGKGNCRKLRSERTNHSPYGPRRGDGGGVNVVATTSKWRWRIIYN